MLMIFAWSAFVVPGTTRVRKWLGGSSVGYFYDHDTVDVLFLRVHVVVVVTAAAAAVVAVAVVLACHSPDLNLSRYPLRPSLPRGS